MYAYPIGLIPSRVIDAAVADALRLELDGYTSAYVEYSVGGWATAPLWVNPGDRPGEEVRENDEPAQPIASVRDMDGLNDLISTYFDVSFLGSPRLFRACNGAIILPRRDYLEHKHGFTRTHVPLITDVIQARNSEDSSCFHMRRGEVRFLEARRIR